jgi:hypothetical protein
MIFRTENPSRINTKCELSDIEFIFVGVYIPCKRIIHFYKYGPNTCHDRYFRSTCRAICFARQGMHSAGFVTIDPAVWADAAVIVRVLTGELCTSLYLALPTNGP